MSWRVTFAMRRNDPSTVGTAREKTSADVCGLSVEDASVPQRWARPEEPPGRRSRTRHLTGYALDGKRKTGSRSRNRFGNSELGFI